MNTQNQTVLKESLKGVNLIQEKTVRPGWTTREAWADYLKPSGGRPEGRWA